MDTILVTGGAGFLGSCFVRQWLATGGDRVVVLDKLTYAGNLASLAPVRDDPRFVFRRGDIGNRPLVALLLDEFRPRAILNFAAETHVDRSIDASAPFVATNIVGTAALAEATLDFWRNLPTPERQQFRLLHVSTDEVYGPIAAPARAAESAAYRPTSPYAASKAAADHLLRAYHRTYGLPILLVHPSNCYGAYQFPEKLVPLVILNAFDRWPISIYGDGMQERDWLYCDDMCSAVQLVLARGAVGESYNVGPGEERTNLDTIEAICAAVDRLRPNEGDAAPSARLMTHVADRPGHDRRYALDTAKIRTLGWRPQVPFDAGIDATVAWFRDNRAWVDEVSAGFQREVRLGQPSQPD